MKKATDKSSAPPQQVKPLLIVLSGPSGVGKDAILTGIKQSKYPLTYITTVTTRPKRTTEKDDIDYHFISTEEFKAMVSGNRLLEWANVYGNYYGVPQEPVKQALERGDDVIIKVDIQGATTIQKALPQTTSIFIMPPSREELVQRLQGRASETSFDLSLRLKTADKEMAQLPLFDYAVVNQPGEIEQAVAKITAIITAEKCRVAPRKTVRD
ncbi:guanylate kinase [Chloroflexota bacterium]